jgi:arylsulfatase A-like enzyme
MSDTPMKEKCWRRRCTLIIAFLIMNGLIGCTSISKDEKPNIIILYVDDLGYADVGCYGVKGVATPNIDSLAHHGVRFTDAHCPSATCTPSRYSLLTGKYAFRNNAAILPGDAPLLIDTSIITLPKMLSNAGYNTAVIGKWHLGLGVGKINWNGHITPGANEIGFDYSFLIPATGDRVPTVFVENGNVVNHDGGDPIEVDYVNRIDNDSVGSEHQELLKMKADPQHSNTVVNGVSRIGFMSGGDKARWVDEDFAYTFNKKAFEFMARSTDKPFFLLYSFHDIHVPRLPHKNFIGKSSMGQRGDVIAQVDWVVGEIIAELKRKGLERNTLIIFTSDNGPVLDDGYADSAVKMLGEHNPSGTFRGGKYSAYEAGTRVPTIVYWPGKIKPKESNALLTQVDLLASLAALTGQSLAGEKVDSQNYLDAWLGKSDHGREVMIEEAFTLALRENQWKYIQPHTGTIPTWMDGKDIEAGLMNTVQLFDLQKDVGERHNLADSLPDKVRSMKEKLRRVVEKD